MPVEVSIGFFFLRIFQIAQVFRLAVGNAIGLGASFALLPFGLLSGRPEIHDVGHSASRW